MGAPRNRGSPIPGWGAPRRRGLLRSCGAAVDPYPERPLRRAHRDTCERNPRCHVGSVAQRMRPDPARCALASSVNAGPVDSAQRLGSVRQRSVAPTSAHAAATAAPPTAVPCPMILAKQVRHARAGDCAERRPYWSAAGCAFDVPPQSSGARSAMAWVNVH